MFRVNRVAPEVLINPLEACGTYRHFDSLPQGVSIPSHGADESGVGFRHQRDASGRHFQSTLYGHGLVRENQVQPSLHQPESFEANVEPDSGYSSPQMNHALTGP